MQAEERQESHAPKKTEVAVTEVVARPESVESETPSSAAVKAAPVRASGRRPFVVLFGLVALGVIGVGGYLELTRGRESTDDAQVTSDLVPVSARVGGQLQRLAIGENELVKKGALIAQIDDADYSVRVREAEAEVASAKAQAAQSDAQVDIVSATSKGGLSSARAAYSGSSVGVASAAAQVAASRAQLVRAQADARKAETDLKRATELRAANAVPQERLDNAQAAFDMAQAVLAQASAQVAASEEGRRAALTRVSEALGRVAQSAPIDAQIAAAEANARLSHARQTSAEAKLALAELQLSYTKIIAPADGIASKLGVHEGQLLSVGQPLLVLVPVATHVVANFKETQLAHIRVGQRATLELDAYPHREFEGKVESISGGTGASFSLLPADNASGNFVKVVQRVPVRIAWVNPPADVLLRAGLSVDATVYVGN